MKKEMLTVKELASYLRVHTDVIYALVREKQIPHVRLGSRILFTKESIHNWIEEQEQNNLNRKS